jgi:hypothetical protein
MEAQTAILAKVDTDTAAALSAAALELVQAEVAAAAAKERRGDKGDDTMSGDDLAAAVKFVHFKDNIKGFSAYSTKAKSVAFLVTLSPPWTERVCCDGSAGAAMAPFAAPAHAAAQAQVAVAAPAPAAAVPSPEVNYSGMTAAQRRAQLAALHAAMEDDE